MSVYAPEKDDHLPWSDTDYSVGDFTELISSGEIPPRFITFLPSGHTEIHGAVHLTMKHYPKKDFTGSGQDPIEGLLNVLRSLDAHYSMTSEDFPRGPVEAVPLSEKEDKVEIIYHNVDELSAFTGMKPGKLYRLLHWIYTENPDLAPWVIDDPEEGYMVAYPVLRQFLAQNGRFDKFLKDVVTGNIRISVADSAE